MPVMNCTRHSPPTTSRTPPATQAPTASHKPWRILQWSFDAAALLRRHPCLAARRQLRRLGSRSFRVCRYNRRPCVPEREHNSPSHRLMLLGRLLQLTHGRVRVQVAKRATPVKIGIQSIDATDHRTRARRRTDARLPGSRCATRATRSTQPSTRSDPTSVTSPGSLSVTTRSSACARALRGAPRPALCPPSLARRPCNTLASAI